MLKIIHSLTGGAALLLSFLPSLRGAPQPYLQQPDALYLALIGLTCFLAAPPRQERRHGLRPKLIGALLVAAAAFQALVVLVPVHSFGGLPSVLPAFACLILATATRLTWTSQTHPRPAAPQNSAAGAGKRETGTVKWFNTAKGFGFISRDSGEDIFVHFRAIRSEQRGDGHRSDGHRGDGHRVLMEGQRVEFSVMQRDKGLQAEDVTIARR